MAPPGHRPMAKTRISTAFNQVMQADLLFGKDTIILHMIDGCIRFSMLAVVESKNAMDLCRAMRLWWFQIFQPPKVFIVDQYGSLGSDDAEQFLAKYAVDRKPKPTDLHATMVERHNGLIRQLLHNIEGQSALEGLPVTDEDIVSEAFYAKSNLLDIGGQHPITAVCGIHPSVLPDFETTSLAITDDQLSPDHAANCGSVRLRETAAKCMVEATAQSRLTIADKTQAGRDGREH